MTFAFRDWPARPMETSRESMFENRTFIGANPPSGPISRLSVHKTRRRPIVSCPLMLTRILEPTGISVERSWLHPGLGKARTIIARSSLFKPGMNYLRRVGMHFREPKECGVMPDPARKPPIPGP